MVFFLFLLAELQSRQDAINYMHVINKYVKCNYHLREVIIKTLLGAYRGMPAFSLIHKAINESAFVSGELSYGSGPSYYASVAL